MDRGNKHWPSITSPQSTVLLCMIVLGVKVPLDTPYWNLLYSTLLYFTHLFFNHWFDNCMHIEVRSRTCRHLCLGPWVLFLGDHLLEIDAFIVPGVSVSLHYHVDWWIPVEVSATHGWCLTEVYDYCLSCAERCIHYLIFSSWNLASASQLVGDDSCRLAYEDMRLVR